MCRESGGDEHAYARKSWSETLPVCGLATRESTILLSKVNLLCAINFRTLRVQVWSRNPRNSAETKPWYSTEWGGAVSLVPTGKSTSTSVCVCERERERERARARERERERAEGYRGVSPSLFLVPTGNFFSTWFLSNENHYTSALLL